MVDKKEVRGLGWYVVLSIVVMIVGYLGTIL